MSEPHRGSMKGRRNHAQIVEKYSAQPTCQDTWEKPVKLEVRHTHTHARMHTHTHSFFIKLSGRKKKKKIQRALKGWTNFRAPKCSYCVRKISSFSSLKVLYPYQKVFIFKIAFFICFLKNIGSFLNWSILSSFCKGNVVSTFICRFCCKSDYR